METKLITPQEADDIIVGWDKAGVTVGLADYRNAGFMVQHLGKVRTTTRPGVHLHAAGSTTSIVITSRYREIILAEDEDMLGIRRALKTWRRRSRCSSVSPVGSTRITFRWLRG